jgi:hypothetical protein
MPQAAMMIDLGEPEILERHVAEAPDGSVGIDFSATDLLEQGAQLILVH